MTVLRKLLRQPIGVAALVMVGLVVLTVLVSLVWTPHDPLAIDVSNRWAPWSATHPLGTDALGRDTASRIMLGSQVTVTTAVLAVALATALGVPLGALLVFLPPGLSSALQRLVDLMVAFPTLVLAVIIATFAEGSMWGVVLAIGLGSVSTIIRTILPELRRSRSTDHVMLARTSGAGPLWLTWKHILPEVTATLLVRTTQLLGVAALAEAGLSYLGLGTPPPSPSWGRMLAEHQQQIYTRPEVLAAPALVIVWTTLGFNLLGDALRDALDTRSEVG
ncbi:ABC transporter permease [Tessaracoccus sp. SD287]|uniref:ABC transporter permease n=1 Tax=Tessaracoccus sp. SD287 TaxID=2782008 RepID=UPI001A977D80|nr:ABC transporter permease [Tessaracoccus sp. SD287]MBO1030940.1 ABC transporter permease [Tessaracoccus sp. SD287]